MALIQESHVLTASNTDILAAPSRLSAIPRGGILTLEWTAMVNNATNYYEITIQTPEGDVPVEGVQVPSNGMNASYNILHTDTRLRYQFTATQGGHFLLSATETGSTTLYLLANLVF